MSQFVYLLNALEDAVQSNNPHGSGYAAKRKAVLHYVAELEGRTSPEARLTPDVRDKAIRIICTGLPGPNVCRAPKCECYEGNGKPIVELLWTLFSTNACVPQEER